MKKKLILPIILMLLSLKVTITTPSVTKELPTNSSINSFLVQASEPSSDIPVKITIPSIGVDSEIVSVGLTEEKIVDTPATKVGWYHRMAKPGERGIMSLNGHFQNANNQPGVFHNLSKLKNGSEIIITDKQNRQFRYQVQASELVTVNDFPLKKIYGRSDQAELNLVTCAGQFDPSTNDYTKRTLIYATLMTVN